MTITRIKRAARTARIASHPDKVPNLNELPAAQQEAVNEKAGKVGEAADVLTDAAKVSYLEL